MHLTLAPGIYIIGGSNITSEDDCTTLLVCSLNLDECTVIGCGSGKNLHALVRNILELGISLKNVRYAIVPLANECLTGCRSLKLAFPWIQIVAPREIARDLREGKAGEPLPISIESTEVSLRDTEVRIELIDPKLCAKVRVERGDKGFEIILVSSEVIKRIGPQVLKGLNRIICFLEIPVCRRSGR